MMQESASAPLPSAENSAVSEQRGVILKRVYWVGTVAFLSAYLLNPGEPGVSDVFNQSMFAGMLVLNLLVLALIYFARLRVERAWQLFIAQYSAYFGITFFFIFFRFPPTQEIHTQLVPLMPYLSLYLLSVYIFLDLRKAHLHSLIYSALFLIGLLTYSILNPVTHVPSAIVTAYYHQLIVVNSAIVLIFMASGHIKNILAHTETKATEIERLAFTDELTGLDNRLFFSSVIEKEFSRFREATANSFSLVIADIDHFKEVNDKYGHDRGDLALKEVAGVFRRSVRSSDLVARWGGEEFIIMLAHIPADFNVRFVVERICKTLANHRHPDLPKITASFGLASVSSTDDSIEKVFARADAALYRAKAAGRNRVEVAP